MPSFNSYDKGHVSFFWGHFRKFRLDISLIYITIYIIYYWYIHVEQWASRYKQFAATSADGRCQVLLDLHAFIPHTRHSCFCSAFLLHQRHAKYDFNIGIGIRLRRQVAKSGKYGCNMHEFGMSSISKVDGVIPILCWSLMTNKPHSFKQKQPGSGKKNNLRVE